jgi:nucleoid-associated protein YgaU
MADSYLRWTINKNFMLGASYHLEDNEHYFGVDFSFSIPAPWLKFKTAVSQEKISFIPSFHTFNYWTFDVKYDYFLEKELVGTNYGVQVTYELVKEYPVIAVYNEFEGIEIVDTEVDSVLIDFGVEDADRLYFIKANLNEETQLLAGKLSEYSKKNYSVPVQLKEGKNVFDISTRAVNGKPINKQIVFNYTLPTWIAEVDSVNADSLNVKDNAQDLVVEVIEETETEPVVEEVIVVEEKQDEVQLIDKYIVKPGDSLWKIAKMPECYNDPYKWKTIYELNTDQIKNPDLIYPDQELIIRSFFKGFYIVKKGDTLWGISKKSEIYGDPLKWRKLYENNKDVIKNPDLIYPNQKLKVGDE